MNIGSIEVMLGANTAGLSRAAVNMRRFESQVLGSNAKMQSSFQALSSQMMLTGTLLTQYLTVPIALLGGVAIKTFSSFETEIAKIVALTGTSLEQATAWSKNILTISKEFGQAPKDVASAMYFIASPALKAGTSMEILKAASKGAAIGLGETKTIANALVSVINAYGESNISASHALDIMVTSVKNGKWEASDLGKVIGKVLPVAQALGVSFEDVGGSLAAMTLTGKSASEAATQLTRLFATLIQSPPKAEKVLDSLGISFSKLRKGLREQGVLKTMQDLNQMIGKGALDTMQSSKAYSENIDVLGDVFTNLRALLPVLDMLGPNMKNWTSAIAANNAALGSSDTAWKTVGNTVENRFNRAVASAKVALIGFGSVIKEPVMAILEKFKDFIIKIAGNFSKLPDSTQKNIISWTLLTAAAGPLLLILGQLVAIVRTFWVLLTANAVTMTIAAIVALGAAIWYTYKNWDIFTKAVENFKWKNLKDSVLEVLANTIPLFRQTAQAIGIMDDTMLQSYQVWGNYSKTINTHYDLLEQLTKKQMEYNGLMDSMKKATNEESRIAVYNKLKTVLVEISEAYNNVIRSQNETNPAPVKVAEAVNNIMEKLTEATDKVAGNVAVGFDTFFAKVWEDIKTDTSKGVNSLMQMLTGIDFSKLGGKGFGIADSTNELNKMNQAMALWKIQKAALLAIPNPKITGYTERTLIPTDSLKLDEFKFVVDSVNRSFATNAEMAKLLGPNYDKTAKDVDILQTALTQLIDPKTMGGMSQEQLNQIQTYLNLLAELTEKEKKAPHSKFLQNLEKVWKQLSDVLNSYSALLDTKKQKELDWIDRVAKAQHKSDLWVSKEKDKIDREYSRKFKAMAVATAIVNGALAITNIWAHTVDPTGVGLKIAASALSVLNTGLQIATITGAKMAKGGQVPAGFPNDSFPAMLSSGETVIPLNKVSEIFSNRAKTEPQQVVFEIEGRKLVGILQNMGKLQQSY